MLLGKRTVLMGVLSSAILEDFIAGTSGWLSARGGGPLSKPEDYSFPFSSASPFSTLFASAKTAFSISAVPQEEHPWPETSPRPTSSFLQWREEVGLHHEDHVLPRIMTGMGTARRVTSFADDERPPGLPGPPPLPTDPDPICQFLANCPIGKSRCQLYGNCPNGMDAGWRKAASAAGWGGKGSSAAFGGGGAGAGGLTPPPEPSEDKTYEPLWDDEAMVDAKNLPPCDGFGRLETGGRFPNMGSICDDPLQRGHLICVSVLPADFAARSGGFCYSDTLNHAAGSTWFKNQVRNWHKPPKMIKPRKFPESLNHRKISSALFNKADLWEVKDLKGRWWPCTLLDIKVKEQTICFGVP